MRMLNNVAKLELNEILEQKDAHMQVRALKLLDERYGDQWKTEVLDRWNYDDFIKNEKWRKGWISFDCCRHVPANDRVHCGITSFAADIFYAYDRSSQKFVDCGYARVRNPFDAKFHRSLELRVKDGCLYAATALLHDIDRYWEAPGGALIRYNPTNGEICKLTVPLPHHYIQSICLDQERDMIYGNTFTPERMFSYNLITGETRDLGLIGSGMAMGQGENIELDDDGNAWSGWSLTRAWQSLPGADSHRLCRYDVCQDKIVYYNAGLPRPDGAYGYEKVEGLFHLGQGKLFASGGNGSIYRVDLDTGMGRLIGTPIDGRRSRLASLRLGPDGMAYGVVGRDGACQLLKFDPRAEKYELLGEVRAGEDVCWQVHDVAITPDGVIYAGENDNPYRSGYLWEIKL